MLAASPSFINLVIKKKGEIFAWQYSISMVIGLDNFSFGNVSNRERE